MTTYALPLQLHEPYRTGTNSYAYELDSGYVKALSVGLVAERRAYMDQNTNPDIVASGRNLAVYLLDSHDVYADISRAVEGSVMKHDWEKDPTHAKDESAAVEDNTLFFLVMDLTDSQNPIPAASLSIADCLVGPSETVQTYAEGSNGKDIPVDLMVSEKDKERGLWDVMAIMAPKEYRRNGGNSLGAAVWAYHGLYKASQELKVHRWIANITDDEFSNLTSIGIPFKQIDGTEKTTKQYESRKPVTFGFYTINVDEIRSRMTETIKVLEARETDRDFWKIYSDMARIAMDGQYLEV